MASQDGIRGRFRPRNVLSRIAALGLLVTLMAATACTPIYRNTGYAPTEAELAAVQVGVDTRETVTQAVGRPSTSGLLNDDGWFYVQSRWRQGGIRGSQELERQVVVISFDDGGYVRNIERFGLEEGRVVPISRRVTETNVAGPSVIQQILGNFGNYNTAQALDN